MSTGRPSRGARVVYKEVESDEDEFESEEAFDDFDEEKIYQSVFPPLTPLQLELRQLCRSGNKSLLKTFLANNPDIDLDAKDPEAGTTALNEVATKSAQFAEIVELLIEAGAGIEVTDGLGNTPLHNAVIYYPSTQETVDLLLEKGANVSAMNYDGSTPLLMADDKDLKTVLRQLKKTAEKKNPVNVGTGYVGSPDLRRMVFDKKLTEERNNSSIIVRYNTPVIVKSPGLLKRKRENDDVDECIGRKRIRFSEQDSTGADIDPQFSDDEDPGQGICSEEEDKDTNQIRDEKDGTGARNGARNIITATNEITVSGSNTGIINSTGRKAVSLPLSVDDSPSLSEVGSAAEAGLSSSSANASAVATELSKPGQKGKQSSITSFFIPRQTQDKLVKSERGSRAGIAHSEKGESSAIVDEHRETNLLVQNILSKDTAGDNHEVSLTNESESLTDARDENKSMPCAREDSLLPASNCEIGIVS